MSLQEHHAALNRARVALSRSRCRKGEVVAPVVTPTYVVAELIDLKLLDPDMSEDRKAIGIALATLNDRLIECAPALAQLQRYMRSRAP